jgi:hypothetical protein
MTKWVMGPWWAYPLYQIQINNKIELQKLKRNVQLKHERISLQQNIDLFQSFISLNFPFNENDGIILL